MDDTHKPVGPAQLRHSGCTRSLMHRSTPTHTLRGRTATQEHSAGAHAALVACSGDSSGGGTAAACTSEGGPTCPASAKQGPQSWPRVPVSMQAPHLSPGRPPYKCSRQRRHPANGPADRQGSTPQAPAGEQGVNSQHILHTPHTAPPQVPPHPPPLLPLLPLPPSLCPSPVHAARCI